MSKTNAIGIDIGGTNLRIALVSREGKVLRKLKEPSTGDVIQTIMGAIKTLADGDTAGIGVGVAGLVDRLNMTVITSPNLPSVEERSFRDLGLGLPVALENDANAAALGEKWLGAGRDLESFVLMTLGTGIGAGVVHKGRLLGVAAEAGHMSIMAPGAKCACGNFGCLEMYASARAITEAATNAIERGAPTLLRECCKGSFYKVTPEDVNAAALEGDSLARDILREAGRHLGVGIANMINLFSPQAVVLSGGLTGAWDMYVSEAVREATRRSFKGLLKGVEIVPSTLGGGDDAGVIGASGLILHGN